MSDWHDPTTAERILRSHRVWAVVGCSPHPWRASYGVSRYLLRQGYEVVPIYPRSTKIHGLQTYPDLASAAADRPADSPIEVVDIFRAAHRAGGHVDEAIEIGAKAIWMQLEVIDTEAATRARAAGLEVVMDRCPAIDHPTLVGQRPG